jgi:hypothetical protein
MVEKMQWRLSTFYTAFLSPLFCRPLSVLWPVIFVS